MTGPLIQFSVKNITPVDQNVCSVKYTAMVQFIGPYGVATGPYVYKEVGTSMLSMSSVYADVDINQQLTYNNTFYGTISENIKSQLNNDLYYFYQRGINNAESYYANYYGTQSIKGYTGSMVFMTPGISGSYYP